MSSKNKWAPAPWTSSGMSTVSDASGECLVVLVNGQVYRQDEQEDYANAHLIAAAPEMYEMLGTLSMIIHDELSREIAKEIDDLLAKARGETA